MHTSHKLRIVLSAVILAFLGNAVPVIAAPAQQAPPELVLQTAHVSPITSLRYSPGGRYLLSVDQSRVAKIWDASTHELLGTLKGFRPPFFYDEKTVVAQDSSGLRFIDIATFKELRTLPLPEHEFAAATVTSPDGKIVATLRDGTLQLFNALDGAPLRAWRIGDGNITLTFTSDGARIVTRADAQKAIKVWDVATGTLKRNIALPETPKLVVVSPDGRMVASSDSTLDVRLWDIATGKLLHTFTGLDRTAPSVAFSGDSRILAGGGTKAIHLWNTATGTLQELVNKPYSQRTTVLFPPAAKNAAKTITYSDGSNIFQLSLPGGKVQHTIPSWWTGSPSLAAVSGRKMVAEANRAGIKLWNLQTGELAHEIPAKDTHKVALSPDGKFMVTAAGSTVIWDLKRFEQLREIQVRHGLYKGHAISPDSRTLAIGHADKTIQLYSLASGELIHTLKGHTMETRSMVFTPDGKTLASGGLDKTVRLWDVETGALNQTIQEENWVLGVDISGDGNLLASFQVFGRNKIRSLKDSALLHTILNPERRQFASAALTPDASTLIGCDDIALGAWSTTTGAPIYSIPWDTTNAENLAFADASRVVCGMIDGSLQLREVATGRLLVTLQILTIGYSEEGPAEWIAFTPEGFYIASAAADKYIRWRSAGKLLPATAFAKEYFQPEKVQQALAGK